jgi:hypothetical protein
MIDKSKAIKLLVDIANSQVGCKEEGGNNKGPHIVKYQQATWLKPDAWPWCAAFICWCIREWVKNTDVKEYMKLTDEKIKTWRPRTAGAFDFANTWAKTNKYKILDETAIAKAGDIVIFDFSHIGLVVEDQATATSNIVCVEGNTNGKGERDSVSGDGVWRKTREPKLVKQYIRFIN